MDILKAIFLFCAFYTTIRLITAIVFAAANKNGKVDWMDMGVPSLFWTLFICL